MGGRAFSDSPLCLKTPRMPPDIYRHMRDKCHAALRQRFLVVASPIESPEKYDYGDVDIFVTWDVIGTPLGGFEDITQLLGATHAKTKGLVNTSAQFAVPWPIHLDETNEQAPEPEYRHVQIDLHVCDTLEDFHWGLFFYAHGDLFSMLRVMMRPYNLTVTVKGLYLQIREMVHNKPKVLITKDPEKALRLLGYDPDGQEWEREFSSLDELFVYTTKCRFFRGFQGTNFEWSDQQILAFRPIFRAWIRDFVPTCKGRCWGTTMSAEAVRDEALEKFPSARMEYHELIIKHEKQKDLFTRVIKPNVPANDYGLLWRAIAARALREIIMNEDYSLEIKPLKPLKSCDGLFIETEVEAFVSDTWQQVGEAAWERHYGDNGRYDQALDKAVRLECEEDEEECDNICPQEIFEVCYEEVEW
ncbi:uncharacterized protein JN550_009411 [Neoarthrinium moseri]|uniref:uncharacterized protein n=1 Tax=Neoarthrinium moseri TaxID=1658444 RepID=UPI001FDB4142|nr:uncharacterized protein JN550_009411 [Neoarthrinium moseri]KAI1863711.1 hypothetical protein JN550_009411 [Neoarthrinium moseri]